jgi:hypothetical protein
VTLAQPESQVQLDLLVQLGRMVLKARKVILGHKDP